METPPCKGLFLFQTVTKCQCFPRLGKEPSFDELRGFIKSKNRRGAGPAAWGETYK